MHVYTKIILIVSPPKLKVVYTTCFDGRIDHIVRTKPITSQVCKSSDMFTLKLKLKDVSQTLTMCTSFVYIFQQISWEFVTKNQKKKQHWVFNTY